ncbi:MAG: glycosyltransferase family 4 protein [Bacteroidales bacterium]
MNNKKLILISLYHPNTAISNRFLAFVKAYGELGVDVKVYFVELNKNYDRIKDEYANVEFIYPIPKLKTKNKYLRFLITILSMLYLFFKIEKNSNVIFYTGFDFIWLFNLRRNLKIYHERTEHPDVVGKSNGIFDELRHKKYLKSLKKIDGLFVISPSLKEYFVEEIKLEEKKVHIINMIVDSSRFNWLESIDKENTISYCGTISIKKDGILDLINSFSIVARKDSDITLTLIGDFQNLDTKNIVHKLIDDLSIRDRIIFKGNIDSSLMPYMLSKSKILALARPYSKQAKYGFATKLGEYLLSDVPSVITNVGDFKYYLKDMHDIIFAEPDNQNDFANKLLWVLDNYEESKLIAKNGIDTANKSFNYMIEAKKVINVIFKNENV